MTVLSLQEEAMICAFRRHALLPLDDCFYALQATILHLQRHGIGRLPDTDDEKTAPKKFKSYTIRYFHIEIAEVRTPQGKLYLFVDLIHQMPGLNIFSKKRDLVV